MLELVQRAGVGTRAVRQPRCQAVPLLGSHAVRFLRSQASALFGFCAVWVLRRLASAPFGFCAVWLLRRYFFFPHGIRSRIAFNSAAWSGFFSMMSLSRCFAVSSSMIVGSGEKRFP